MHLVVDEATPNLVFGSLRSHRWNSASLVISFVGLFHCLFWLDFAAWLTNNLPLGQKHLLLSQIPLLPNIFFVKMHVHKWFPLLVYFTVCFGWILQHGSVYKLAFGPKAFVVVSDPIVARHILRENAFSYDKVWFVSVILFFSSKNCFAMSLIFCGRFVIVSMMSIEHSCLLCISLVLIMTFMHKSSYGYKTSVSKQRGSETYIFFFPMLVQLCARHWSVLMTMVWID